MQNITVEQLKQRLDAGETLTVVDVREPDEYAAYNIGAMLIPLSQIMNLQLDKLENMQDQEIIIHCQSGRRSVQACMMLEQAGYSNLTNVLGGVAAWQEKYGDTKI